MGRELARAVFGLASRSAIDKRRIRRLFGRLTDDELDAVDEGLELFLGLSGELEGELLR